MPELLAAVAKEMDLFLPVQNNGITNFGFWTEDAKVAVSYTHLTLPTTDRV